MKGFEHINEFKESKPGLAEKMLKEEAALKIEEISKIEQEATEEEKNIINDVFRCLPWFLERFYGIKELKHLDQNKIHVVKKGSVKDYGSAVINVVTGDICLEGVSARYGSIISFTHSLVHELLHYLSFHEIVAENEDMLLPKRSGLGFILTKNNERVRLFKEVDEAIVALVTNHFCQVELDTDNGHGIWKEEVMAMKFLKSWVASLTHDRQIDVKKWSGSHLISIPFAIEISKIIESSIPEAEKIKYFNNKMSLVSEEDLENYFFRERGREINKITEDLERMFADEIKVGDYKNSADFIVQLVKLMLTGDGYKELIKMINSKMDRGAFKKLKEKYIDSPREKE
jgi:hypothetical protein